jgi:transposase-like protein
MSETVVLKRTHTVDFKNRVLAEVEEDKESLSAIARKHKISPALLFMWRKKVHDRKPQKRSQMLLEDKSQNSVVSLPDTLDLELKAMNDIYSALKPLNDGCRKRVMDWVAQRVIYV